MSDDIRNTDMTVRHLWLNDDGTIGTDTLVIPVPDGDDSELKPCDRLGLIVDPGNLQGNAINMAMTKLADGPRPSVLLCGTRRGTTFRCEEKRYSSAANVPAEGFPRFAWVYIPDLDPEHRHEYINLIVSDTMPVLNDGTTPDDHTVLEFDGTSYRPIGPDTVIPPTPEPEPEPKPEPKPEIETELCLLTRHKAGCVVTQASYDSTSNSCDLANPVSGVGSWCHYDHFQGDGRPCHGCTYAETNWRMTRPGAPMPDPNAIPNVTWLDDDGNEIGPPVENLIHVGSKGNSGEKIAVQYCKRCRHHQHTNAESRRQFPEIRVCLAPAFVTDGTPPTCLDARTVDGRMTYECPHYEATEENNNE